jgi:hypothetical protein
MRTLGFILTIAGFLAGAFSASLDPRIMEWSQFVPALLFGAFGVFLVRHAERRDMRSEGRMKANRAELDSSLSRVVEKLAAFEAKKGDMTVDRIAPEVDAAFRDDLTTFADARETIAHLYGIRVYAEVMSAFATGERYLNRVWSSSVDGYLEESRTYLTKALEQFREAKTRLDSVQGGT